MSKYFLLLLILTISTVINILLKIGADQAILQIQKINSLNLIFKNLYIIFTNQYIITAISLYAIGFLLWLFILSKFELSFVFPIMSSIYIIILIFSWFFLNENITNLRIIGTLIIVLGIIMVLFSNKTSTIHKTMKNNI